MTKKPHEDTQLAQFVERRILELRTKKTQAEIAAQAGFNNANMVTMIKQGKSKAALDRGLSYAACFGASDRPDRRCCSDRDFWRTHH